MKGIVLLISLALLIIIFQYYLLAESLTLGFKPDDWILYFSYKLLGSNTLSQILSVWAERGIYTTYQVYYMGLLDSLVGLNYYAFHYINLIFKILATLSIYPLILVLFNRQLLAILSVILFSISASTVGPLEFVVKGSDYLAIVWMNLFLIVYYLIIKNRLYGLKYHFLLFLLFFLSLAFSPIRIFPLAVIPPITELFLMLKNFKWNNIRKSLVRLTVLYWPFIIIILYSPIAVLGDAKGPIGVLKVILEGNWFYILAPLSGIGYLFITNEYWGKIFGSIITDNFKNYVYFLAGGPTVIYGVLTAILAWSRIPGNKLLFFVLTSLINFTVQILFFLVAFHHLQVPAIIKPNYDSSNLYSVTFGGYILIVGFMTFIYWLKWGGTDRILSSIWIGSFFSFIFIFLTWLFAPVGTGFDATSYYLVVGSIGSSLVISAFLLSFYDKLRLSRLKLLVFIPFLMIIPISKINIQEVSQRFSRLNEYGRGAKGQIMMQEEAKRVLQNYKEGDSIFVYFDTSEITNGPFYSEGFLTSLPYFMHFRENKLMDGCIGVIYEDIKMLELRKLVQTKGKIKGFEHPALCVNEQKGGFKSLFFTSDQFYAFKIKDKKLIDIKKDVFEQLNIN